MLFRSGRYEGNPFGKHLDIAQIAPVHFERWLDLFAETAAEQFEPSAAQIIAERAHLIGDSLKAGLFFHPGSKVGAAQRSTSTDSPS